VLAYAGAPVTAKSLECGIMELFTSMRIEDNLKGGISTFYAELLRIKTIIQFSALKRPMIFLLDEIFRGTNSKDRIIGAKSVISNLNKKWIIGIVSTHDFELCDLENEDRVKMRNFHFTEHYINDEIRFDYRLKNGRCHSTNAKYLMKLAGIELKD
jgi:DNA mismatch repair ATPase MutS